MAAVDFFSAFQYTWAQTGSTFAWDDSQYKLGWATIGSTPPSVEQFNRVHQVADQKANWLYGQLATVAAARGVTLDSASLTGLQQVLAAYGQSSVVDSAPGAWMQVGAFGLGNFAPAHNIYGYPSDFDLMDARTGWVTLQGNFTHGPAGAASLNYRGVLEVSRGGSTDMSIRQEWSGHPTAANGQGTWVRYGTGGPGARVWSAWELVYTSRTIPTATTTVSGISPLATNAEAIAGTDATKSVTPAALAAAVPAASTTVVGKSRLATTAEAIAGSLATVAVTPAGLAAAVPAASETAAGKIEIATAAEAQGWTLDNLAITPKKMADAFKGANQSLIASGYQKLPGGLIEQWAIYTNTNNLGTGFTRSTFPIAFPNAVLAVEIQPITSSGGGYAVGHANLVTYSTPSQFDWTSYNASGVLSPSPSTLSILVRATGY